MKFSPSNIFELLVKAVERMKVLFFLYKILIQEKEGLGWTPLHFAARLGNSYLVMVLLMMGESPNTTTKRGETALHLACQSRATDDCLAVVKLLLGAGAAWDKLDNFGCTPLSNAVSRDNTSIKKVLLSYRADKEKADQSPFAQMSDAVRKGSCDLLTKLMPYKIVDLNHRVKLVFEVLLRAVEELQSSPIKELLENKEGLNWTPLHFAAQLDNAPLVVALLMMGECPNAQDKDGKTPLHLVAYKWLAGGKHLYVLRLLLGAGADVDKQDRIGSTPLYIAAARGQNHLCKLLLEAGADKDKEDEDGNTPLLMAARNGHEPVVARLLEAGADMDKATCGGAKPLLIAAENGHEPVVARLLEAGADKEKAK